MSTNPPTGRGRVWTPFWRRFTDQRATDLRDTITLQREVTEIWKASFWSDPHALAVAAQHTFDKLNESRKIPQSLHAVIHHAIREILQDETHIFTGAEIDWSRADLSLKEQVDLRRFLRARQFFLSHEEKHVRLLSEIILSVFATLIDALPNLPDTTTSLIHVPLGELVSAPGRTIDRMNAVVMSEKLEDTNLFSGLRDAIYINACRASGVLPHEELRKPLKSASDAGLPPQELFETYLGNTPFASVFDTPTPLTIARQRFNEHGCIFAKSGHGKTQALRAIVAQFLREPDPPALFLIDSLGSLIEGIGDLEVFTTSLKDRLVILDPSDPRHLPRLNFFSLRSDDLCFYLFKAIDQSFTPRQATMISYLMEYMRAVPEPSLYKLVQVCESKKNLYPEALDKLTPFAKAFFEGQFFGTKGDKYVQDTKTQIAQRLYTLGRLPKFTDMFSGTSDFFDPYRCMQERKVVLINTDARPPDIGGLGHASAIFGRYVLALCLAAARRRPKDQRHLALLVVDEAKHYMDEHAALILSDARQFGLGMLLASQFPHQLDEGVRREINTNTSIRFMGPVEYAVASQYARDMFTTPEFIMSMKSYDRSHAEWALYVSSLTERALKVQVPYGVLEAMPKVHHATSGMPRADRPASDRQRQPYVEQGDERSETDAVDSESFIKRGKDWD